MAGVRTPPKGPNWREDWKLYGVLASSKTQRESLTANGELYCCVCDKECSKSFHAEHQYPLWLVNRSDYPSCLARWSRSNLTAICLDCHKAKTKGEATARAKCKRLIEKQKPKVKKPISEWQEKAKQRQREYQKTLRRKIKMAKPKKPMPKGKVKGC